MVGRQYMKEAGPDTDRGPFVHTWTGGLFYLTNPRPEEVFIEDIAHSLSLQCRFNGHIEEHYSVAEHSIMVSNIVEEETKDAQLALTALLHDSAEAYLGDVVSPLKKLLPEYRRYEVLVETCIARRLSLVYPFPDVIHAADKKALEHEFLFLPPFIEDGYPICPLLPKSAEKAFLARYLTLLGHANGVQE